MQKQGANHSQKDEPAYQSNPNAFVYLKADKTMQKIYVNDSLYIKSCKDYVKLFFTGGKYLLIKKFISAIENLLSGHQFLRVHRSYIILVKKVSGYTNMSVKVQEMEIPIGRLNKQVVINYLMAK